MTVHHDKLAYGKVASLREQASEDRLAEMAQALAEREYDKMVAGKLYNPADEELTALRRRARKLARAYNDTDEEQAQERTRILGELFGSHGSFYYCEPPVRFDYGCNFHVGDDFFANFNLTVLDCAPVCIGKQCFIGPNVSLLTPVHPFLACDRNMRRAPSGEKFDYEYARPITIGDNVWIAGDVTVCGGVTIGHDTVIGAGSVVTRDIPSGVLAAGNPCRVIRPLTERDKLELPR